jgi:hypothetical protein
LLCNTEEVLARYLDNFPSYAPPLTDEERIWDKHGRLNRCMTYATVAYVSEMEGIRITLDRYAIAYVRFIFEGYDGLGMVSTLDPHLAQALITYPICNRTTAHALIRALQDEGAIKEVCTA